MTRVAVPFLTLPEEIIQLEGMLGGPRGRVLSPLRQWGEMPDRHGLIEVRAELKTPLVKISDSLQIPRDELRLDVHMRARTGPGKMPYFTLVSEQERVNGDVTSITCTFEGNQLCSQLEIELCIVLAATPEQASTISPRQPGSRLWKERELIQLSDGHGLFPMEAADLTELEEECGHAPWYLWWQSDGWESDFSSAVRLYINSSFPDFCKKVESGDPHLIQAILADCAKQLILAWLNDVHEEGLKAPPQYEAGTVGAQVVEWLTISCGEEMTPSMINERMRVSPSRFHATITAGMELPDE